MLAVETRSSLERRAARAATGMPAKIAFLSDPSSYPDEDARTVEVIETHLSWVFLTRAFAYKLKKPDRFDHIDLGTIGARHVHAVMELHLNRRFSDGVYFGVVPLRRNDRGMLELGGEGRAVDWLLQMRRLPARHMLSALIARGRVPEDRLRESVEMIARCYRMAHPETVTPVAWRHRLERIVAENRRELASFPGLFDSEALEETCSGQLGLLAREPLLVESRARDRRIVEGHGDLRPEHVCLDVIPQVIDCLEFSRELRVIDPAQELGFLALECERLGAPQLRAVIFDAYAAISGDRPAARLIDFYQSVQACVRARLTAAHLRDAVVREPDRWAPLARRYLELAQAHLRACAFPKL
ncbi:MAG: hypothetical protein ACM3X5_04220 [Bacillota bacterium]